MGKNLDHLALCRYIVWCGQCRAGDDRRKEIKHSRDIFLSERHIYDILKEMISIKGQYSSVYCTCNLSTNSTIMVEKGMGYSLVVEGSLPFLDFTKITYRPLSPEISFTSVLAWKRQQPFSPAASKLIEHFKTSLDKKKQTR
nr:LysR substrate-binding domain-containing protein [uncultured Anaerostipes sp.]